MYTLATKDDCTCCKCSNARANKTFGIKVKELAKHMGFVPRQYDIACGFNKIPKGFGEGDQIPKHTLDSVLTSLELIIAKNKATQFASKKHVKHCADCGKLHVRNVKHSYQGGWLCSNCFESRYKFCTKCNSVERRENMKQVREKHGELAHLVCGKCFNMYYTKCMRCGSHYASTSFKFVVVNNQTMMLCEGCRSVVTECAECGSTDFADHMHHAALNRFICTACMEEQLPIKEYNYKPNPLFQLDKTCERSARENGEFMGLEWEVENCGPHSHLIGVSKLMDIFGKKYIYCKKDSSIFNGFEVVTHPFSYPNFVARRKDWAAAMDTMYELGYRDKAQNPDWHKTVGIHIHINKWAFSTTHLYKFMKFFYNPENRGFLIDISQRGKENYYAKFHPEAMKNLCKSSKYRKNQCKVVDQNDPHAGDYDKNVAVNLKPAPTVEVRIFASTLNPRDFFKNVEFIRALFLFSKDIPISEVTVPKFLEYCMGREAKTYKNLYTFLCEAMTGHLVAHNIKPTYDFSGKGVV